MKNAPAQPDWSKVDWTLSNAKLAEVLGISIVTVWIYRCNHGPRSTTKRGYTLDLRRYARWIAVDWTRQNRDIAQELKVSKQRVDQVRRRVGAPAARLHGRHADSLSLPWRMQAGAHSPASGGGACADNGYN